MGSDGQSGQLPDFSQGPKWLGGGTNGVWPRAGRQETGVLIPAPSHANLVTPGN